MKKINFEKVSGIIIFTLLFMASIVIFFDLIFNFFIDFSLFGDNTIVLALFYFGLILTVSTTYLLYIYFVHPNDNLLIAFEFNNLFDAFKYRFYKKIKFYCSENKLTLEECKKLLKDIENNIILKNK